MKPRDICWEYPQISTQMDFKSIEGGEDTLVLILMSFLLKFKIDFFQKYFTNHTLEFKFQNYDEISNETYLGLSQD